MKRTISRVSGSISEIDNKGLSSESTSEQNVFIDYINTLFTKNSAEVKKIDGKVEKLNKNIIESNDKIIKVSENSINAITKIKDEFQSKQIEILGLFITLFGFISVSFQIFSRVESALIAGFFIILIFCCLTALAIIFSLLMNKELTIGKLILLGTLLLISVITIILMRNEKLAPTETTINTMINNNNVFIKNREELTNLKSELQSLKNCLTFNTPHYCSQK